MKQVSLEEVLGNSVCLNKVLGYGWIYMSSQCAAATKKINMILGVYRQRHNIQIARRHSPALSYTGQTAP